MSPVPGRVLAPLLLPFRDHFPRIAADAFIAPSAVVIGDVTIGAGASVWFNCVVRGDEREIVIGARTNIQDGTVIHVSSHSQGTHIGAEVTVGHMALLHACTIADGGFVGMGAIMLDESVVESGGMLAAGAMLTPGKRVRRGELWAGRPARLSRMLTEADIENMPRAVETYLERARNYRAALVCSG